VRLVRLERQQSRVADDVRAALASLGRGSTVIGGIALIGVPAVGDRPIEAVVVLPHGVLIVIGVDLPDPALRLEAPLGAPWKADGWPLVHDDEAVNPATEALDLSQACERRIAEVAPGTAPIGTIIAVGPFVETVDQPATDLGGPVRVLHPTPTTMLAATVSLATAHRPRSVDQARALINGLAPDAPEFSDEILLGEGFSRFTDDAPHETSLLADTAVPRQPSRPAAVPSPAPPVATPVVTPNPAEEPPESVAAPSEPEPQPEAPEPDSAATISIPTPPAPVPDEPEPDTAKLLPLPELAKPAPPAAPAAPLFSLPTPSPPLFRPSPVPRTASPMAAAPAQQRPAPQHPAPQRPAEPAKSQTVRWIPLAAIGLLVALIVAAIAVATSGDDAAPPSEPPTPATAPPATSSTAPVTGLQLTRRTSGADQRCASHAFGDVQASLQRTSCAGVRRASYSATVDGRSAGVTIGIVEFPDAEQADAFKAVADTPGGGGILDLATETGKWPGEVPKFENAAYASKLEGNSVRLVQAAWAPGPSTSDDPGLTRAAKAALDLPVP
jgi:hypothetical protein